MGRVLKFCPLLETKSISGLIFPNKLFLLGKIGEKRTPSYISPSKMNRCMPVTSSPQSERKAHCAAVVQDKGTTQIRNVLNKIAVGVKNVSGKCFHEHSTSSCLFWTWQLSRGPA